MGIANRMDWTNEGTARLAGAFDKIGYENHIMQYLDEYTYYHGEYGYDLDHPDTRDEIESLITSDVDSMYERFWNNTDHIYHFFIEPIDRLDVDFEQIARAYIDAYHDYRNIKRGQTSRNSKTSSRNNQKKPAPKRKPTQRRK